MKNDLESQSSTNKLQLSCDGVGQQPLAYFLADLYENFNQMVKEGRTPKVEVELFGAVLTIQMERFGEQQFIG
ncbi:MAG: hypothetical protein CENE_02763 [Candidatus Celerinatantimonas neptuna]|nr:MAG: hypothetical protein CENE_02763 [Candidatus Celerinatantimonas neptuna]